MTKDARTRLESRIAFLAGHVDIVASGEHSDRLRQRLLDLLKIRSRILPPWSPSRLLITIYLLVCTAILLSSVLPITIIHSPAMTAEFLADAVRIIVAPTAQRIQTSPIHVKTLHLTTDGDLRISASPADVNALLSNLHHHDVTSVTLLGPENGPSMELDLPTVSPSSTIGIARLVDDRWRIELKPDAASDRVRYVVAVPQNTTVITQDSSGVANETRTPTHATIHFANATDFRAELVLQSTIRLFRDVVPVADIGLHRERAGDLAPVSSIVGGEVNLPDVRGSIALRPRHDVKVELDGGSIWSMSIGDAKALTLRIDGDIRRLLIEGQLRTPTVMVFVGASRYFNLIWGSIVAVTGFFFLVSKLRTTRL